jgi:hypothetical protein
MRMLFPIEYEIHGTTRTNRRPARYFYREAVAIDIPEVRSGDAPVAVEWTPVASSALFLATSDRAISGPDGKQLTRWHWNSHWQRLCDGHFYGRRDRGRATTVKDLEAMLASPNQDKAARAAVGSSSLIDDLLKSKIVSIGGDPRGKFVSVRTDGRETQMKQLDEVVSGLISVDGILHRKCLEPFVAVSLYFENGELRARDLGIEATEQALWGPTATTFAFFGVSKWDEAVKFALENGYDATRPIPGKPEIMMDQTLTYDWDVSYKAATEIKALVSALSMFSRIHEPRLAKAIRSQDADEQHEIMLSINPDDPRWVGNASAIRSYTKVMDILENRAISLSLVKNSAMRP